MFFALFNEVADLDWTIALKQLLNIFNDVNKNVYKTVSSFYRKKLYRRLSAFPSYIKMGLFLAVKVKFRQS